MEQADLRPFHQCMFSLSHCLPVPAINLEVVTEYYFADLVRYPWESVEQGFVRARRTCRYFPTIAELLDIVDAIDKPRRLAERAKAEEAYKAQDLAALRAPTPPIAAPESEGIAALVGRLAASLAPPPPLDLPAEERAARKEVLRAQFRLLQQHEHTQQKEDAHETAS